MSSRIPDGLSLPKTTNRVKVDRPFMTNGEPITQEELPSRIFRSTLPEVYGYPVRRLNGDRRDAEDVTQETYLAYVEAMRAGVVIEPGAWLQVVARNQLVDHLRTQGRRSESSRRIAADEPVLMRSHIEAEALL
jgi:RNA polymerase sigma factor (sigma-70 family)